MTPPPDTTTPRARCYHTLRHTFTNLMVEHFRKNPQLLIPESQDALVKLLLQVIEVLDGFAIEDKVEAPPS